MKILAIDMGASNGRGILGELAGGKIAFSEIYRFKNEPVERDGSLLVGRLHLVKTLVPGTCGVQIVHLLLDAGEEGVDSFALVESVIARRLPEVVRTAGYAGLPCCVGVSAAIGICPGDQAGQLIPPQISGDGDSGKAVMVVHLACPQPRVASLDGDYWIISLNFAI